MAGIGDGGHGVVDRLGSRDWGDFGALPSRANSIFVGQIQFLSGK